nr:hypothetical protein [Oceanococcus sp. HetDA_MAG_MS8]
MQPEAPLIIVAGPPLGGLARVALALGRLGGGLVLPELTLGMADNIDDLCTLHRRSQSHLGQGLLRALAYLGPGQTDAGIEQVQQVLWRRGEQPVSSLLRQLCRANWQISPDPHLGWRPDYGQRLLHMPQVRVLHLSRHPLWHGSALYQAQQRGEFMPAGFQDFCLHPDGVFDPQLGWFQMHRNLSRLGQRLGPRYRHISYTAFARDPQQLLRELARDWHLQPTPGHLAEHPDWVAHRGPSQAPGGWDQREMDELRFGAEAPETDLDQPMPWRLQRRLSREVQVLAAELGYGSASA